MRDPCRFWRGRDRLRRRARVKVDRPRTQAVEEAVAFGRRGESFDPGHHFLQPLDTLFNSHSRLRALDLKDGTASGDQPTVEVGGPTHQSPHDRCFDAGAPAALR